MFIGAFFNRFPTLLNILPGPGNRVAGGEKRRTGEQRDKQQDYAGFCLGHDVILQKEGVKLGDPGVPTRAIKRARSQRE